jgi:hypothetical protein
MTMFTFGIVKRLGDGNYLLEDNFIIERVRKERAMNVGNAKRDNQGVPRSKNRFDRKDGRKFTS